MQRVFGLLQALGIERLDGFVLAIGRQMVIEAAQQSAN
jgi:hypothetical protein